MPESFHGNYERIATVSKAVSICMPIKIILQEHLRKPQEWPHRSIVFQNGE